MKKMTFFYLFLFILATIAPTLVCHDRTQAPFSLHAWSNDVLQKLPEYSEKLPHGQAYHKPLFTAQQFLALADDFVNHHRTSAYNDSRAWLEYKKPRKDFFALPSIKRTYMHPYSHAHVQRKTLAPGSNVCFVGDIHGSIHSIIRMLWRLVVQGKLADDLTIIDPTFYMVFNGDFVDRGRYGIEVWYTLLQLKRANWDKVFLLRGNHEDEHIQSRYGFADEIHAKFADDAPMIKTAVASIAMFLPHALYLGSGTDNKKYYFQCCHGGIELGFNPVPLLTNQQDLLQLIPQGATACNESCSALFGGIKMYNPVSMFKKSTYCGFNWSDFCQIGDGLIHHNKSRGEGYIADVLATQKYLDALNNHLKKHGSSIVGFIRGHQDTAFGFKMLFDAEKFDSSCAHAGYANGPFHWREVVDSNDLEQTTLNPAHYVPVFTLSTASEGQSLPYDCFCIVTMEKTFNQSKISIYETLLPPQHTRHKKYLALEVLKLGESQDMLNATWHTDPVTYTLSKNLAAVAKK